MSRFRSGAGRAEGRRSAGEAPETPAPDAKRQRTASGWSSWFTTPWRWSSPGTADAAAGGAGGAAAFASGQDQLDTAADCEYAGADGEQPAAEQCDDTEFETLRPRTPAAAALPNAAALLAASPAGDGSSGKEAEASRPGRPEATEAPGAGAGASGDAVAAETQAHASTEGVVVPAGSAEVQAAGAGDAIVAGEPRTLGHWPARTVAASSGRIMPPALPRSPSPAAGPAAGPAALPLAWRRPRRSIASSGATSPSRGSQRSISTTSSSVAFSQLLRPNAAGIVSKKVPRVGLTFMMKERARNSEYAASRLQSSYVPLSADAQSRLSGKAKQISELKAYMATIDRLKQEHSRQARQTLARSVVRDTPQKASLALPRLSTTAPRASERDGKPDWLVSLREKVEKYGGIEHRDIDTPLYNQLLAKESEAEAHIDQLRLEDSPPIAKLPPDAQKLVESVMSGDRVVVEAFGVKILSKDIRTLKDTTWLNDEVINFYGEMCMKRAKQAQDKFPRIHVFNTFFYEQLRTRGYSSVRRWTKKVDLFEKDLVIVPVHLGAHWTCAVINLKQKRFEYYDSLHGSNPTCQELLREYLKSESLDKKKTPIDLSDWEDYTPKNIPAQQNSYDCGVFTCMFMEHSARQAAFRFSQRDMPMLRTRIAYEIIKAELL
ncbi:hypothetical protein HK105_203327 [Polyrhizophydium stewartii]|uniref:Ubiquitin-like protease family profile domain-containing protein n=1 Tax=Polyrhizophydium stewartii TaxID=2732419 RepID=A0ABR4NCM5_9FUNG